MEIRQKIIGLIEQAGSNTVDFTPYALNEPTAIYRTSGKGEIYEAFVTGVMFEEGKLSFKLDLGDDIDIIYEDDGDIAFRCHEWLVNIFYNMCETLDVDPELN
jgi:hypothetical protein